ncbi:uncharacterized protein LOC131640278 [Vicia villosa]|uniref:uncharacterized protein LOC131640278 n=1 Tax=Vicia villosa TaxID=3911 RepID=UPI00273ABC11|nr:uncharacterized protein LOC131640278 [Vicia villosa]
MKTTLKFKAKYGGIDYITIPREDIMDLCMGTKDLCFTILQVWLTYLHHHCMELGKSDVYGFLDPYLIHSENDQVSVQTFIQNKMHQDQKDCYLAPYLSNHHWQLIIINPKKHEVVLLCSMGKTKSLDKSITRMVEL